MRSPPSLVGSSKLTDTRPTPANTDVIAGAPGTVGITTAFDDAEYGPNPFPFDTCMMHVYVFPGVNGPTMSALWLTRFEPRTPPSVDSHLPRNSVICLDRGGSRGNRKSSLILAICAIARTSLGGPGLARRTLSKGITGPAASEYDPRPTVFLAATRHKYATPTDIPPTTSGDTFPLRVAVNAALVEVHVAV
ncbi:MAG: hypothetical protein ACLPVY_08930 [Acidimicrobiia bacterium]